MKKLSAVHPGKHLREAMRGKISIKKLATHIDASASQLSHLVNGRGKISPLLSLKLDEAFSKPYGFWLDRQWEYDMTRAKAVKRKKLKWIFAESGLSR